MSRTFDISKTAVLEAWKRVKSKGGGPGIDGVTIAEFEKNLKDNLYRIWNRMSSGSYFPPHVRSVEIPKKSGGFRRLGVPTTADRVAQGVVAELLDIKIDPIFCKDSYGYRKGKSALDAIAVTRERCWKYEWVLEFDVRGLFDNIPHALLLKALNYHVKEPWVLLYVERWLKASMVLPNGNIIERDTGTPQGGVVSPILANLFMHYAFDKWMQREFPKIPWCRYADDGLAHCASQAQAEMLRKRLAQRLLECGLEIHPDKTRIIYCNPRDKSTNYPIRKFSFLGYEFRGRMALSQKNKAIFVGFLPAICPFAAMDIREQVREVFRRFGTHKTIGELSQILNPMIRGWFNYYGCFQRSALAKIGLFIDHRLMQWAGHKYANLFRHRVRRWKWLKYRFRDSPKLFAHWAVFPVSLSGAG